MDIKEMKHQAFELFEANKKDYTLILLIICLISLLPSLLLLIDDQRLLIVYGLLVLILLPIHQGQIIASLNIVEEKTLRKEDSLIGLRRFPAYFTTYLMTNVIEFILIALAIIVFGVLGFVIISIINFNLTGVCSVILSILIIIVLMIPLLVIILKIMSVFLLVPYLLTEDIRNFKNMRLSFRCMKSHFRDYLKIHLSFLPYYILFIVFMIVLAVIDNNEFINNIFVNVMAILTFLPKYDLTLALFYKEIYEKIIE